MMRVLSLGIITELGAHRAQDLIHRRIAIVLCGGSSRRAGGGTPAPLPPSAVLFNGTTYRFSAPTDTFIAGVSAPADGAWLTGSAEWDPHLLFGWDCSHSYTADLSPNNNDYAPLFIAGWSADRICTDSIRFTAA